MREATWELHQCRLRDEQMLTDTYAVVQLVLCLLRVPATSVLAYVGMSV